MKLERVINDDGLTVMRYTFRQSGLNEYLLCPERARAQWHGEVEDTDTAEAAIGTAVHFAAEMFMRGDGPLGPSECLEAARELFRVLSRAPGFRWVKVKTEATAFRHIETCFETWLRDIEPRLGHAWGIELPFKLKFSEGRFLTDDEQGYEHVEIWLTGCIDFVDETGPWDYKTTSRLDKYTKDAWQLKRWAVQPTVYTWALHKLGYFDTTPIPFTYAAMCRTGGSTLLTVEREHWHWSWLEAQLWNIVAQDNAGLSQWPLNDQHALCSPDWCPKWATCKGLHVPAITLCG